MNSLLGTSGLLLRLAFIVTFLRAGIPSIVAEESRLYVFWDTVSADGKYALAWSTTGKATIEDLPSPYDVGADRVSNYVIELGPRKILVKLPDAHYWRLYGGGQPNHYSLESVWSENSRSTLVIYDSRWKSDMVFLVDVSIPRAARIEDQLQDSFERILESARGNEYRKYKDSLVKTFGLPWFVAPGKFYVWANASVPKQDHPDFNFGLVFQIKDNGARVSLVMSEPSSGRESADRSLNRAYRTLRSLLSPDEQRSLVKGERAWLTRRDAIKSKQQKDSFTDARTQELQARVNKAVEAKEKQ
jgi:hypothetical protein